MIPKPCPRCHAEAPPPRYLAKGWWMSCDYCFFACIPGDTEYEAVERWNQLDREPTILETQFAELVARAGATSQAAQEVIERYRFLYPDNNLPPQP